MSPSGLLVRTGSVGISFCIWLACGLLSLLGKSNIYQTTNLIILSNITEKNENKNKSHFACENRTKVKNSICNKRLAFNEETIRNSRRLIYCLCEIKTRNFHLHFLLIKIEFKCGMKKAISSRYHSIGCLISRHQIIESVTFVQRSECMQIITKWCFQLYHANRDHDNAIV